MNSEFEWRNGMRKLGGAVEPQRDLWPAIAARIATERTPVRRRPLGWFALAASLIVAIGAGLLLHEQHGGQPLASAPVVAPTPTKIDEPSAAGKGVAATALPRTALDWAVPEDPRLAATAQDLDNASAQLQDALEQRPDAVFLVGLLNRTNSMRLRLMRKSPIAD